MIGVWHDDGRGGVMAFATSFDGMSMVVFPDSERTPLGFNRGLGERDRELRRRTKAGIQVAPEPIPGRIAGDVASGFWVIPEREES